MPSHKKKPAKTLPPLFDSLPQIPLAHKTGGSHSAPVSARKGTAKQASLFPPIATASKSARSAPVTPRTMPASSKKPAVKNRLQLKAANVFFQAVVERVDNALRQCERILEGGERCMLGQASPTSEESLSEASDDSSDVEYLYQGKTQGQECRNSCHFFHDTHQHNHRFPEQMQKTAWLISIEEVSDTSPKGYDKKPVSPAILYQAGKTSRDSCRVAQVKAEAPVSASPIVTLPYLGRRKLGF